MSNKNKLQNKTARRETRGENYPRTPMAESVPRQIATKILTNPLYKVSARQRQRLSLRRGAVVEVPRTPAREPAVKLALKLQKLTLATLHRRLKQSARRAATAKEILSDLSPGSQFATGVLAEQTHQLGVFKQVKAEILSRQ